MKMATQREVTVAAEEPTLPEGPRPFALRFAEVFDHVHRDLRPKEFGDQVTVHLTANSSDMITLTD